MKSLLKQVEALMTVAIKNALAIEEKAAVTVSPQIGDFRCTSAMKLFNQHKKTGCFGCATNLELAEKIIKGLPPNSLIAKIEATPMKPEEAPKCNYFINITLNNAILEAELMNILKNGLIYKAPMKSRILVDFSSPNIAKELHVGHLRSTIIGECTCRVFEFLGNEVLRINHVGDWGTQFGMLTAALYEKYPDFVAVKPNLGELKLFYQEAKKRFDADEEFKKRSHQNVVLLQGGDPKVVQAWQYLCDLSRVEFEKIYKRLNITIKEVGESFYNPLIKPTIQKLEECKLVEVSDGAKIIRCKGKKAPLIIQKKDGGYNYDSTDMAAINYRLNELKCDRLVYITDVGQQTHFEMVFDAATRAGWLNPKVHRVSHMGFGLVLGEGGKKIKTRSGDADKLMDLLDEATHQAEEQLVARNKELAGTEAGAHALAGPELKEAAEKIGMASIKYFDLKQNRVSNYTFSYERMLDPKGDTALYLLYAYARMSSILKKVGLDAAKTQELIGKAKITLTHPKERSLAFEILKFPDTIDAFSEELAPNKLCDLVHEIAVNVGEFYENCKVIGQAEQDSRLLLIEVSLRMMKTIMSLLGIEPLSKL